MCRIYELKAGTKTSVENNDENGLISVGYFDNMEFKFVFIIPTDNETHRLPRFIPIGSSGVFKILLQT